MSTLVYQKQETLVLISITLCSHRHPPPPPRQWQRHGEVVAEVEGRARQREAVAGAVRLGLRFRVIGMGRASMRLEDIWGTTMKRRRGHRLGLE
jgi:hypothetical protein